jgi:hypothetical protein
VQSAAQDEMAFEQRAGVAENLENFVLCHRTSFKFRVSSFNSKPNPGWTRINTDAGRARHSVRAEARSRSAGGQKTPINREPAACPTGFFNPRPSVSIRG